VPHLLGVDPHKDIVALLVGDGEPALRLLIVRREGLQPLDRVVLADTEQELDVALGVLVARVDAGVVGQAGQHRVERAVHLVRRALEELATPADEERVAGEDGALVLRPVLDKVADAVLRVARRVQRRDGHVPAQCPRLAVLRRPRHLGAVLAPDDGDLRVRVENLLVPACVVPVVVRVDDRLQVDLPGLGRLQARQNFGRVRRVDDGGVTAGRVRDQVGIVIRTADPWGLSLLVSA